ncbi:LEA type 2 family protein [Roseospira goensis]|uniref:LEA14-like dessication related protein n=1 Tax=Roseospira goensis TaxID=391922 RepID=A0A7W6WJ25_9PROT|nr:LEA type 2 family protein [Roseospira goensis]MBB4284565.1 LEA14-like dessication related protein [Roseospira goensis]
MLSRRAALAAVAALPLAACAAPGDLAPPEVALRDVRFIEAGLLQQDVDLLLSVTNPNTRDMPITGMRAAVELNGRPLARGYSNETLTVPRLSTQTVPVRAQIGSLELVQQVLALGNRGTVDYVLSGEAFVGRFQNEPVPFRKTGSLNVLSGGGVPTLTTR